jgi:hypothetical protein
MKNVTMVLNAFDLGSKYLMKHNMCIHYIKDLNQNLTVSNGNYSLHSFCLNVFDVLWSL